RSNSSRRVEGFLESCPSSYGIPRSAGILSEKTIAPVGAGMVRCLMSNKDLYSVTFSRINESANKAPYETLNAHTITVTSDGTLSIQGEQRGVALQSGLWDGFEVKRLQDLKGRS